MSRSVRQLEAQDSEVVGSHEIPVVLWEFDSALRSSAVGTLGPVLPHL